MVIHPGEYRHILTWRLFFRSAILRLLLKAVEAGNPLERLRAMLALQHVIRALNSKRFDWNKKEFEQVRQTSKCGGNFVLSFYLISTR